jgi:hypothetical protein
MPTIPRKRHPPDANIEAVNKERPRGIVTLLLTFECMVCTLAGVVCMPMVSLVAASTWYQDRELYVGDPIVR